MRVHIRLNTVGRSDGLIKVAINGVEREFDKMVWRTDPAVHLSSVLFDTFFGGNSPDYASVAYTCSRFCDVRVTRIA
jgi:hypothetical protein